MTTQDVEFSNWMRKFYNNKSKNLSDKGYEYGRWHKSYKKQRQYNFSSLSLLFHLKNIDFKSCLEIGCGSGTWTKLLIEKYPKAKFQCVDISKEMIIQFKQTIKSENVKADVINFLDYKDDKKYDFIFSSRAIEYIPDKPKVIKKFYNLMEGGAKGIIITSPPHPFIFSIKKFFGKKIDYEHTQRISVRALEKLLRQNGFRNIEVSPILFSDMFLVPTSLLFTNFYKKKWGLISKIFASGYIVKFEK